MNIPSLPTDNLYKFMAIFGLAIFFFSFYLLKNAYENLQNAESDLEVFFDSSSNLQTIYDRQLLSIVNNNNVLSRSEIISKGLDSMFLQLKDKKNITESKAKIFQNWVEKTGREINQIQKDSDDEKKKFLDLIKKSNNLDSTAKEYMLVKENMSFRYKRNFRFARLLFIAGLVLMVYGFSLWYTKHQRYIDAERRWKGETFVELLKEKKEKDKLIQEELKNKSDEKES